MSRFKRLHNMEVNIGSQTFSHTTRPCSTAIARVVLLTNSRRAGGLEGERCGYGDTTVRDNDDPTELINFKVLAHVYSSIG